MMAFIGGGTIAPAAIDMTLRRVLLLSKLFTKSWGHPKTLRQLAKHRREIMSRRLIGDVIQDLNPKMIIEKEVLSSGVRILEGRFLSPHASLFPEQMPNPSQWAKWRGVFPSGQRKGLCIHLAGTGDHSYFRRELFLANDLLKEHGIASIMVQTPFYSDRKPPHQFRSSLENVSDLFVMGAALMSECNFLLQWAKKEGYSQLAISGVSMGGYMASLASSNVPYRSGCIPILSWTSASPPYTEGAIAPSINYPTLLKQLEDPHYLGKLKEIPDVHWVEEMKQRTIENGKCPSYNMMRILMDEFTLLSNYPTPVDTSLCSAIIAEQDAYVLRTGAPDFKDIWPGMKIEVMKGVGHVQAYLLGHGKFRDEIAGVLRRV